MDKRSFLKQTGLGLATLAMAPIALANRMDNSQTSSEKKLAKLTPLVKPITRQERLTRIAKAQKLMSELGYAAIILEPGAAMDYFSGIQWWRSERLTALIIPREGEPAVVCPFFEEPSIRETLAVGEDVRVWQEHQSPFKQVQQVLTDRGIKSGKIGFESSVRYFVLDGVMSVLNTFQHESAEPVTLGCRMFKSPHELQLMHKANEITLAAYAHVWSLLEKNMTQQDVKNLMKQAQIQLGGSQPWGLALFNQASAYPHGTRQHQEISEGSVVLMDCGCQVEGYQSDISRTFVFGESSKKQRQVWDTVRKGQQIAFETAQIGIPAGRVDDKVRAFYATQGYGPDYKLPGLSHRTGHGIGM